MAGLFDFLFLDGGYSPHGYCLAWEPHLLWLHVGSNLLIGLAYLSIPIAIFHFIWVRDDLPRRKLGWLFAAFIGLCGVTHLVSIATMFIPIYGLEGVLKAITAAVSLVAAAAIFRLNAELLSIPSRSSLLEANERLANEVNTRARAEEELRSINTEIEARIAERTRRLRESEERWQLAVEGSSEGIWDWDVSRGQVYWSARNRQMLGYEAAQFVDTLEALRDRVHPEDLAGLDGALERHLTKGEPFEHVYRIRAAHGGWHWWQTRGNTTRDPMGRPLRILGINRDITEEKAREAELEEARIAAQSASEAKSRFLAHMSHEIRTPMNGIIGMADLLGEGMLDPDQRTAVETIVSSGETLMAIIDDVLDFSKVEAGKIVLTDGPVDPVTEIETVAALLASGARDKGLGLILDLDLDLPPLRGDALRMRQVITNLIGNAIKFTDAGQVSISLRSVPGGPPGMIEIEVVDTGRGIAADEHASIFDAFEQASRDRSSEPTMNSRLAGTAGTGLGLAICRSLCEIMGGSIDVDSIPGQGASFRARFGLSVDTSAGAMPARSVPVSAVQGNAGGILVLSPLEGRRRAIGALAARTGRVVATAASVQSATPSAMAQRFSLAVVDEALLGQAEREAASAALAALPGAPPVVVLRRPSVRSKAIELPGLTVASLLDEPVRPRQVVMLLSLLASGRSRATPTARSPGSGSGAADEASLRYPEASVLVVEDNRVNRVVIGRMLERMVAKVAFAETGGAALSFIEETRPDLILMDVQLPDEDGLSVTRRIRASEAATGAKPLTIVALTANAMPSDKDAAAAAGMNDFLAKPVRLQALADCIDRWLFPESEDQSERAGRAGGE